VSCRCLRLAGVWLVCSDIPACHDGTPVAQLHVGGLRLYIVCADARLSQRHIADRFDEHPGIPIQWQAKNEASNGWGKSGI